MGKTQNPRRKPGHSEHGLTSVTGPVRCTGSVNVLLNLRIQAGDVLFVEQSLSFEEDDDGFPDFAHTLDVSCGVSTGRFGRGRNLVAVDVSDFVDGIDDESDLGAADVDNDDTGSFVVFSGLHIESKPHIEDGNDLTAKVDNAFDEDGHIWNFGNFLHPDDFGNVTDFDSVIFVSESEGEIHIFQGIFIFQGRLFEGFVDFG